MDHIDIHAHSNTILKFRLLYSHNRQRAISSVLVCCKAVEMLLITFFFIICCGTSYYSYTCGELAHIDLFKAYLTNISRVLAPGTLHATCIKISVSLHSWQKLLKKQEGDQQIHLLPQIGRTSVAVDRRLWFVKQKRNSEHNNAAKLTEWNFAVTKPGAQWTIIN